MNVTETFWLRFPRFSLYRDVRVNGRSKIFEGKRSFSSSRRCFVSRDIHLLQICSGIDEKAVGAYSELVFAPIDEMFPDDAPLLPSGFRISPLDTKPCDMQDTLTVHRTLDLTSSPEVGPAANRASGDASSSYNARSELTSISVPI
ncbi:homeobox-leucine zipper protein REVOLUTA-like [Actinidia eriantha]|uniref:homeobox-leucine zipper protein REVOLUTA-like n=1 Tax=Actinidia eriantha TaxID=165200 RepID=UPI00258C8657|nr:homeobox-leucine zipper protein REVOLUTA-like [Actinidia eriantha]